MYIELLDNYTLFNQYSLSLYVIYLIIIKGDERYVLSLNNDV